MKNNKIIQFLIFLLIVDFVIILKSNKNNFTNNDILIGVFSSLLVSAIVYFVELQFNKHSFVYNNAVNLYTIIQSIERLNDMVNVGTDKNIENKELRIRLIDETLKNMFQQSTYYESNNPFLKISGFFGRHKTLSEINTKFENIEVVFKDFREIYIQHCNGIKNDITKESEEFMSSIKDFKNKKIEIINLIKSTLYTR